MEDGGGKMREEERGEGVDRGEIREESKRGERRRRSRLRSRQTLKNGSDVA